MKIRFMPWYAGVADEYFGGRPAVAAATEKKKFAWTIENMIMFLLVDAGRFGSPNLVTMHSWLSCINAKWTAATVASGHRILNHTARIRGQPSIRQPGGSVNDYDARMSIENRNER